jgi:hypothetical protein
MSWRILLLGTLIAIAAALPQRPASAAAGERCFVETGYCISGAIRAYWERGGGLPVFGYPIGPQQIETVEGTWTGPVQWFERDRLEDHSDQGIGVLAGRLGARYLELQGRAWQPGDDAPRPGRELCRRFDVTGYNVCGDFRAYWEQHGGLERFGYPITPAFEERVEGVTYLVQYFERRRMEYHPELVGTPYAVLLGLLGRDIVVSQPCAPTGDAVLQGAIGRYAQSLGCPRAPARAYVPAAVQPFERGWMLWVGGSGAEPPMIFVLIATPSGMRWRWEAYRDTARADQPPDQVGAPPPGREIPVSGFGRLWLRSAQLREQLGWATAPERADTGSLADYGGGAWVLHLVTNNPVFVLQPGGFASVELP